MTGISKWPKLDLTHLEDIDETGLTSQKLKLNKTFYYSLPKLIYCTGQVGGVQKTVVGKAALSVPRVITSLPWQLL